VRQNVHLFIFKQLCEIALNVNNIVLDNDRSKFLLYNHLGILRSAYQHLFKAFDGTTK